MSHVSDLVVGTWTLAAATPPATTKEVIPANLHESGAEDALIDDSRKVVADPSKYGAIVKLFAVFERMPSKTYCGTGWLISDRIVVTAAHVVYDWDERYGKAISITAYSGYNGKKSIGTPKVQKREGVKVATTMKWLTSDINGDADVAFVLVDQAFKDITPIKYQATQESAKLQLGVVGYPMDKNLDGDKGAQMYEQFKEVNFNLATAPKNLLQYRISTFGGQSGSPVLIAGQNTAIGVHVSARRIDHTPVGNQGTVIRGKYGNFFKAHYQTLTQTFQTKSVVDGITYVTVPGSGVQAESGFDRPEGAEGFFDVFKKVVAVGTGIGSTVLKVGSPFFGPIGGPIAAVAGQALGFANKLATGSHGAESSLEVDHDYKGLAERAVLSEGALHTVLNMTPEQARKHRIFEKMHAHWEKNKEHIRPVATNVLPAIMEPSLRIALHEASKKDQPSTEPTSTSTDAATTPKYPTVSLPPPKADNLVSHRDHQFAQGLTDAAAAQHHEEGFFDFLGGVVKTAVRVAPHIGTIAKVVGSVVGGTESDLEPASQPHLEALAHRSVMSEGALQALMDIPPHELHAEGFFSSIIDVVKRVGPVVVQAAPVIAHAVTPVVKALLTKSPESCFAHEATNAEGTLVPRQAPQGDTGMAATGMHHHLKHHRTHEHAHPHNQNTVGEMLRQGQSLAYLAPGGTTSAPSTVAAAAQLDPSQLNPIQSTPIAAY